MGAYLEIVEAILDSAFLDDCSNFYMWRIFCGGGKSLIYNMFGLQCQYNLGNWYIYFYGYALLVLPLLKRGMLHDGIWRLIVAIVVFGGLATLFSSSSILSNCFRYSQVLAVGL